MIKSNRFKLIQKVAFCSVEEWFHRRAGSKGAALAFYTLFSMAPLLILVISLAGAIFGEKAAQGEIFNQLNALVGPTGAQGIQLLLASAHNSPAGPTATIIATILILIGATTVFSELKDSLDELWHVPPARQSGLVVFIRTRLLSFGLILVLAFLLLVSLVVSTILQLLQNYWSGIWSSIAFVVAPVTQIFSFLVITCLFASIFKLLPNIKIAWRDVWVGALGTAALFVLGKYLIGVYLGNSGVASSYGAAGSVIALLLWVYYSAQIFFFGAEFTRQYALWYGSLRGTNEALNQAKVAVAV
jgi:membrane protein